MSAPETEEQESEKRITVVNSTRGYAHTRLSGTCGSAVTVEDIRKRFYHPYFGGRDAWVRDGQWGAICHDD